MKKSSTKGALFTSALALLLCFVMLLGTTFAWFTDEVTSTNNKIQAGTLEIDMLVKDVDEADSEYKSVKNDKAAIFNYTNWEPGYVEAKHVKVDTDGSLALKYTLKIVPIGDVEILADVIDVYYAPSQVALPDRSLDGLTRVGTLREVIEGKNGLIIRDQLIPEAAAATLGKTANTADFATIALKMIETAGNDYQGKKIGTTFDINLFATQFTYEEDSFDNMYDELADAIHVNDLTKLQATIDEASEGSTILIEEGDYTLPAQININKSLNIVGEGEVNIICNTAWHMFMVSNYYNTTEDMTVNMKNINFDGNNKSKAGIYAKYNLTLNLEDVTLKNTGWADLQIDNGNTHSDGNYYSGTKTIVNAKNVSAEDVALNALPTNPSGTEYRNEAHFNYDVTSTIGRIEKQIHALDPTTLYINGDNTGKTGTYTYEYVNAATSAEVADAINNASADSVTTIILSDGTYADDIQFTVANVGESKGDFIFKAAPGTKPVIAGTVTLGLYERGTFNVAAWDGDVTFEGITFDHANALTHSIDVQNLGKKDEKSLTLKDCVIIGDGEYGIDSTSGCLASNSKIIDCTFINAGMQVVGNFGDGLVIDGCTFNNSQVNVQGGWSVAVQNCTFNKTITDASVGDSVYLIRSNSIPITVKGCKMNIDSELASVAGSQAKWGLMWNRGTTNWTVDDVTITLTDAAKAQTELLITKTTSTGAINCTNVTVNGVQY